MVININLTPQEIQSLYQASAVTGLSVDELIHNAMRQILQERQDAKLTQTQIAEYIEMKPPQETVLP